ncbi:MAG: D-xylose transporter XylE [Gammaproteobacteria bacterium]|jgi:SP family xylose:H+ symportor-like MFS transporter|nr:D-xylose transporter XylE [Gammaproteobacteria bacterium]
MAKFNTPLVVGLTFVATLGGLLFGWDTAVISGAVSSIDAYFIDPLGLSETARTSLSGWTISSALVGCIIGAAVAGWISTALGRKGGLIVAALLFFAGSLGSAVPEFGFGTIGQMGPHALWPFIFYRILGGVGVGIASMLSPLYIAEISPSAIRGRLVSFNQLAIVLGILVVYFVNWYIASLGNDAWLKSVGWRWMLASEAIPSAVFLVLLVFVPDTPRWLVLRGRNDEALAQLKRVTEEADARSILGDIQRTLEVRSGRLFSFGPAVVVVGILISVFQQFVGINAVLYYAPLMFQNMGASTEGALLQTIVVGAANVVFTVVAIVSVDRLGRKPLLVAGAVVMAAAMIALGCLFNAKVVGLGALVAVVVYIGGFAFSWGPVAWVLLAEMFPNSIKGKGLGLAVAAQWLANLVVSASFKVLDGNSTLNALFNHGFAYWIYGGMSVLAALFVIRYVPETKGRSLEAIQDLWGKGEMAPDTQATTARSDVR